MQCTYQWTSSRSNRNTAVELSPVFGLYAAAVTHFGCGSVLVESKGKLRNWQDSLLSSQPKLRPYIHSAPLSLSLSLSLTHTQSHTH